MSTSTACASARTAVYRRRRPEHTVLYRTVQTHLSTWVELSCDSRQGASGRAHVEREFRPYLECGILAQGFARARCLHCGHDFLIAWSCKGRGVCPACNTRRMVETAAHLADHVFPPLPIRQWVLSVPKRLRYHLQHDPAIETLALRIFLRGCEFFVSALPPGAAGADVARKGTILRWRRKRGCRLAFPPLCPDFGVSQPPNQAFALPRTYLCLDRPIPVRESQRAAGCAPGRTERRQPSLSGYPVPVVGSAPGCAPAR